VAPPGPFEIADIELELQASTPRPAQFTRQTRLVRYALLNLAILLLLCLHWRLAANVGELRDLADNGQTTWASIVGSYVDCSNSYYLDYQFSPPGAVANQTGRARVRLLDYLRFHRGDCVKVTYLPDRPDVHRLGTMDDDLIRSVESHGISDLALVALIGAVTLGAMEWHLQTRLRLLREGIPVVGAVVSHVIVRGNGRGNKLVFSYDATYGDRVYREVMVSGRVFNHLCDGDPITVLYDEARPALGVPYLAITEAEIVGVD
jgi:hypothetical protein